ncbi:MAG: hypothetical protein KBF14_06470 [Synergistaceae bacterium]|nr:hypothetical protein [Synergistaceae bacterium]MBP9958081.1 hypothetical protein [Synergistaceae bacterium]
MQFTIERLMGLFWVLIQQICFSGLKWVYQDISEKGTSIRRSFLLQGGSFFLLCLLCFGRELSLPFFPTLLLFGERDFYPWSIRILLCSAMILFDALIVLYFYRLLRLYEGNPLREKSPVPKDLGVLFFVGSLFLLYTAFSIKTILRHDLSMWDFVWIGRFFIQISNLFYITFEVGGALLFWRFLKRTRLEKIG